MPVVYPTAQTNGSAFVCWPDEPLFWAEGYRRIRFHPIPRGDNLAIFLAHRVTHNPRNLLAHVQRIALHLEQADEEALYGALLDLFLTLGENGQALRKRMFRQAIGRLTLEHAVSLRECLEPGMNLGDPMPLGRFSVLSNGMTGDCTVVSRNAEDNPRTREFLEEVSDLIDSGQVSRAQSALEEALLEDPGNTRLSAELLELYVHTKDASGFLSMLERLKLRDPAVAQTWGVLTDLFSID